MTENFFPVSFTYHGVAYEGRVSPEHTDDQGNTSSYHVVLNNVFFGYMSRNGRHWQVSEQRPAELAEMVGFCIDNYYEKLLQDEPHQ
ncbi:MAG: hypothetical protein JO301_02610 [Chitinophagaceae bacterium]|nr:hypothetical protein [Chitinophagaceae bacterium]